MMPRRFLTLATSALLIAGWALAAAACDQHNTAKATSSKASRVANASGASGDAAACRAHGTTAEFATAKGCASKNTAAMASAGCCASKNTAATASAKGSAGKNTSVVAATRCSGMMGAVFASTEYAKSYHCSGAKSAMAKAGAGCTHDKGASTAYDAAAAGGPNCSSHASGRMTNALGACDACADMFDCQQALQNIGTQVQAVPLKNGVMFVYTADAPSGVRAVQAAMTRRNDRLAVIASAGDKASLCPECRTLRGAIASGKLMREMVNIEGGCLTLMTSRDPAMIARLHSMAGIGSARAKS